MCNTVLTCQRVSVLKRMKSFIILIKWIKKNQQSADSQRCRATKLPQGGAQRSFINSDGLLLLFIGFLFVCLYF